MQGYKLSITLLLILNFYYSNAQKQRINEYGLPVLFDKYEFLGLAKKDSSKAMIELKELIPNVTYELRYAGTNNFTGKRMYPKNTRNTFLRLPAALSLKAVQAELNAQGYGLKIWDAYRPYSVTVSFWELIKDDRYVADPRKGSGHNRGIAVDLTIINLTTQRELDMGTGFDNFSDTAHHSFQNLPRHILDNRRLLKSIMEKSGFVALPTEWWHYSLPNAASYEILDLPFKALKKIATTPKASAY